MGCLATQPCHLENHEMIHYESTLRIILFLENPVHLSKFCQTKNFKSKINKCFCYFLSRNITLKLTIMLLKNVKCRNLGVTAHPSRSCRGLGPLGPLKAMRALLKTFTPIMLQYQNFKL